MGDNDFDQNKKVLREFLERETEVRYSICLFIICTEFRFIYLNLCEYLCFDE